MLAVNGVYIIFLLVRENLTEICFLFLFAPSKVQLILPVLYRVFLSYAWPTLPSATRSFLPFHSADTFAALFGDLLCIALSASVAASSSAASVFHLAIYLSICLRVRLPVRLPVFQSVCVSIVSAI